MNNTILITGGTGTIGKALVEEALERDYSKIIVLSRDEHKQYELEKEMDNSRLRFFIGDVRDKDRLLRAFNGVDYVIHTAALKHVEVCEYNPYEAVKTNVLGAQNVIEAAIDSRVKRVVSIGTDKAVSPNNLYGATKKCSDQLFITGNVYSQYTRFSVVRLGNVFGSRGSVVPLFEKQSKNGVITITDPRMTRFWITKEEAVRFILQALQEMKGREIFVPKLKSIGITELAESVAPMCRHEVVGIRPGERLHETMIADDEARYTVDCGDYYIIMTEPVNELPEGFSYCSDKGVKH